MSAPPVQYVKTNDGYNIAFTVQGSGQTLVILPFAFSHAQAVWTSSSATPLLQSLSQRFRVVYYDSRGQGLSQRGLPAETSIASMQLDLHAVLDKAAPNQPILLADNHLAHLAARFALENPRRVRTLVFMHCPVSLVAQISWLTALARQNWDYFLSSQTGPAVATSATEVSRRAARIEGLKARTNQEDFLRIAEAFATSDLADILPGIITPTLVLHVPSEGWVTQEQSAATAALLPNGRLAVEGGSTFFGEPNEVVSSIESFLAEAASLQARPEGSATSLLSPREIEVLRLVAAGKSNQQIASELVIALNTVNRHVSNVYAKTGAASRAEAIVYAHRHGLAGDLN